MTDNLESKINGKIPILVVDDDLAFAKMSKRIIEESSNGKYEAYIAKNCKEAMGMLENKKYPLVISDFDMPEMNGLKLYDWIAKNISPKPKFILASGHSIEEIEFIGRGNLPYIQKPFKAEDYISLIEKNLPENFR